MSIPRFKPHIPASLVLSTSSSAPYDASPSTQSLVGTWCMVASSSSMWQDNKHSIAMTYSTTDTTDAQSLNDIVTWYTLNSAKKSTTKGTSTCLTGNSGTLFDWKGAGWLRMIRARWEVIGLGSISLARHDDTASCDEPHVGEEIIVVLTTFAAKTLFSPQAISVYVQQDHLTSINVKRVMEAVTKMFEALNSEEVTVEVGKLKSIPWE